MTKYLSKGRGVRCEAADSYREELDRHRELQHKHAAAPHLLAFFHSIWS